MPGVRPGNKLLEQTRTATFMQYHPHTENTWENIWKLILSEHGGELHTTRSTHRIQATHQIEIVVVCYHSRSTALDLRVSIFEVDRTLHSFSCAHDYIFGNMIARCHIPTKPHLPSCLIATRDSELQLRRLRSKPYRSTAEPCLVTLYVAYARQVSLQPSWSLEISYVVLNAIDDPYCGTSGAKDTFLEPERKMPPGI